MDALALSGLGGGQGWSMASLLPTRTFLQALDSCGGFECMPSLGPQVLRVSLVSASVRGLGLKSGFYLEAWTEPAAGHPKNSRIHQQEGRIVDLGGEQLELDWIGDERELVLHLVEYSRDKQSRDLPKCELRVPSAAIRRYAAEAEGQLDVRCGSRSFAMAPVARQEALQRKRRFRDMFLPSSIATRIFTKLGEEQGLHIPSNAELESLRVENAKLKQERTDLLAQSGLQSR